MMSKKLDGVRRAIGTSGHRTDPDAENDRHPDRSVDSSSLLEVSQVSRSYGKRTAVRDVSFRLGPGVTGLLGPNGAGKTSLLDCLVGLAACDSGEITGGTSGGEALGARRAMGFMPERVAFPPEMRVRDYLAYAASAKKIARAERHNAVELAVERAGLIDVAGRIVGNLSKGYRQRLGLAQALLGDPDIVVLDEPMNGLDPLNILDIRHMLAEYARERAVLLSTHVLADAQVLCDRVIVMSQGAVVYDGEPEAMAAERRGLRVLIRLRGDEDPSDSVTELVVLHQVRQVTGGWSMVVGVDDEDLLGELVRTLSLKWLVATVEPTTNALEDAFRNAVLGVDSDPAGNSSGEEARDVHVAQA